MLAGTAVHAQSPPAKEDGNKLRVMASLALNKAAREREVLQIKEEKKKEEAKKEEAKNVSNVLTDFQKAKHDAEEKNVPLFIWIGGADEATLKQVNESGIIAIHVAVKTLDGDGTPRLAVLKKVNPYVNFWFANKHPSVDEIRSVLKTSGTQNAQKTSLVPHSVRTDLHTHRCGRCGNEWSHGSENHGDPNAHMCPACGSGPWYGVYRQGGTIARVVPRQTSAVVPVTTVCPT